MDLLERDVTFDRLDSLLTDAAGGSGRVVLIRGEAGIGKTSVAKTFVEAHGDDAHVLWGGCDDLLTARPLGPVWDMVFDEPGLAEALESGDRQRAFAAVFEVMTRVLRPTVVVIEDVQWADEATLDLIKYLGRRIDRTHGLLLLTYRDAEVPGDHPLRVAVGDLPHGLVERIRLDPLSRQAVADLVGDDDAGALWEISGGNPFFVSECLAALGDPLPASISDAVNARLLRLSPQARKLVEVVSVAPGRMEIQLAEKVLGDISETIREAEQHAILEVVGNSLSFRHELARRGVEEQLAEIRRRNLNLDVLSACELLGEDLSRCAHHARQANDAESIIRILPEAARRASQLESHREAVSHLRALEPYLDRLTEEELADHYDLWAYEEYLAEETDPQGIIQEALSLRRALGDPSALGRSLIVASRIEWVNSRRAAAIELAEEAARVLEPVGGEQLAMAYSTLSQLAMLANDEATTLEYAGRALDVVGVERTRARAHALNNIGSLLMMNRFPEGVGELEESLALSRELGLVHDQSRAIVNLAWGYLFSYELDEAAAWIETALTLMSEIEMPTYESYFLAEKAILQEMRGAWVEAEATAQSVLDHQVLLATHSAAAMALAKVSVRRGAPGSEALALDAWERALKADEFQRLGPAGAVLAEQVWLGGEVRPDLIEALNRLVDDAIGLGARLWAGELAMWLTLAAHRDGVPTEVGAPFTLLGEGMWEEAALYWEGKGVPYERAVALSHGNTEAKLEALRVLDELGAHPLAARVRSELQRLGVKGVPRGPQRATRESPLGLTPRQTEVLELLGEGLTNAEIADRMFVSTRTVDHHVSAILSRLGADTRVEAVEVARNADLIA